MTPDFVVFNAGLVFGALLGFPFVYRLYLDTETLVERIGIAAFGISLVGMLGVGVAYLEGPLAGYHFLAAATFFLGFTVMMWIYGTGLFLRGMRREGVWTIGVGTFHVVVWIVWILLENNVWAHDDQTYVSATYFAVPEYVGALLFGAWVAFQARRLLEE